MMGNFTESAARLAGHAAVLLGWRPDDFWGATPAELAGVLGALSGGEDAVPPAGSFADRATLQRLQEAFPDG